MLWKAVPDPYSGNWRSSVAVGCESGTGYRELVVVVRDVCVARS